MTTFATSAPALPVTARLTFFLALASGVAAANIYYVQPIAGLIAQDYGMAEASAGLFVTVTQVGYALGLILAVPLADIVENRRLIVGMLAFLFIALAALTSAPTAGLFMAASLLVGAASCVVQIIVPYAGHLAPDATRGRMVGRVVSGILFGVMLARPASSFAAHVAGPRAIFGFSSVAAAVLSVFLWRVLPDRRPQGMPYGRAIRSLWPLLRDTKVLQLRSAYQMTIFAGFSIFWTATPLLLSGPKFGFSQAAIGLFALGGAAGAFISPAAGRWADQGKTKAMTAFALSGAILAFVAAMAGGLLAFWPLLLVAALLIDLAAATHLVAGQRAIFAIGAEVRGRLNGIYLALLFAAGGLGSCLSGYALALGGWTAVCLSGLFFPLLALIYFTADAFHRKR